MIPVVVLDILTAWQWVRRILFGALFAVGLALAIFHCSGCGAGAMQAHVRGGAVAWEVIATAQRVSVEARDERSSACHDDPCLEGIDRDFAPIVAGLDSARAAWTFWISGVHLAHMSGSTEGMVLSAVSAAGRFLALWDDLVHAFTALGLPPPLMPEIVTLDASAGAP